MKKAFITLLFSILITVSQIAFSQPPPPSQYGEEGNQPAASIGGGLMILLGLGAAYGAKKAYGFKRGAPGK